MPGSPRQPPFPLRDGEISLTDELGNHGSTVTACSRVSVRFQKCGSRDPSVLRLPLTSHDFHLKHPHKSISGERRGWHQLLFETESWPGDR